MAGRRRKSTLRFRRLDRRNFVYEVCRFRKLEDGKQQEVWEVGGFFSSLKSAVLDALRKGLVGGNSEELLASIKQSEENVLNALHDLKLDPSLLEVREQPEKVVVIEDDAPTPEDMPVPTPEKKPRAPRAKKVESIEAVLNKRRKAPASRKRRGK